jgi:ubiquitin-conjugating enzyme E2 M
VRRAQVPLPALVLNVSLASCPAQDDLMNFKVYIMPDEGYWAGGRFQFSIAIPANYPHEAPKVHCDTKSYHPNLDLEGNVCLNILREEWKPILSVSAVVHGLQFLFLEPNPEDPLNKQAVR